MLSRKTDLIDPVVQRMIEPNCFRTPGTGRTESSGAHPRRVEMDPNSGRWRLVYRETIAQHIARHNAGSTSVRAFP